MTRGRSEIQRLVAADGVALAHQHPGLARTMRRMAADGELIRVLPGVFTAVGDGRLTTRLRAVTSHYPTAVVTRTAAAVMTFWPDLSCPCITLARSIATESIGPYLFEHRSVPAELVRTIKGIPVTAPSLTALDLTASHGAAAIDRVLRSRATTVAGLHAALAATPSRRGNPQRLVTLLDSRGAPWSAAERQGHRLLREAGIDGWVANREVHVRSGRFIQTYYLDIAFEATRTALEIEGHQYHSDKESLHYDRYRQNDLVACAGWDVLRVDPQMLNEDPGYFLELASWAQSRRHRGVPLSR